MTHNGTSSRPGAALRRTLLVLALGTSTFPGCSSQATVPEAESQKHEAKDLQDAIEEIQKDTTLSARDKARAMKPLRQRLERIPHKTGQ